jgi:hypothetical protein
MTAKPPFGYRIFDPWKCGEAFSDGDLIFFRKRLTLRWRLRNFFAVVRAASLKPEAPELFEGRAGGNGFLSFVGIIMTRVRVIGDAHVAQLAERVLGKDEVISSTLIMGSIC